MNDEVNFDEKFKALGEYYNIESPLEIRKQLKMNENIFIFLEKIKPFLEKSFSEAKFNLQMNFEPETDNEFIILRLDVSEERFNNGISDEINSLEFEIWDLEKELDVRDLLIMPGIRNV